MNPFAKVLFSATALLGAACFLAAQPVSPGAPTTVVSVPEMHCPSCAKKMTRELLKVQGVAQASANIEEKKMIVTPKNGATLSPRQIWEAVERSGYRPANVSGPSGAFNAKPQS